jgi:hypothetical protein
MRSIRLALMALTLSLPLPVAAQNAGSTGVTPASQDTAPAPKKKKGGGLFGKMKGLTQNKTLQSVAKAAACNMVPGGQLVATALDSKKNAKNAAKNAAAGAALGAKQQTCGAGGLMGSLSSKLAGGVPGGIAGGAAGGLAGVAGATVPGLPTTGLVGGALSAKQLKQMQEQYKKMGMNPAQIQAMQQQAVMQQTMQQQMMQQQMMAPGVRPSPEQVKQLLEQYRQMGMDPAQIKMIEAMLTGGTAANEPESAKKPKK